MEQTSFWFLLITFDAHDATAVSITALSIRFVLLHATENTRCMHHIVRCGLMLS